MKVVKSSCDTTFAKFGRGHILYTMVTDVPPTTAEIAEEQIKLGYHPGGYGGPYQVTTIKWELDGYVTTWRSSASAD